MSTRTSRTGDAQHAGDGRGLRSHERLGDPPIATPGASSTPAAPAPARALRAPRPAAAGAASSSTVSRVDPGRR